MTMRNRRGGQKNKNSANLFNYLNVTNPEPEVDRNGVIYGKSVPHPIPYQGSKRNLATHILACFPPKVTRLVEPFAGSAAVSLAAAFHMRAEQFWINDAHEPISRLWKEIVDNSTRLTAAYSDIWNKQLGKEREYYNLIREKFNQTQEPHYFLFLLARCVKAAVRYNSSGQFNNSPDNRRLGAIPETMGERITGACQLLYGRTKISALDYQTVLTDCEKDDLVYMDPPYQGVCGNRDNRYSPKVNYNEFCEALAQLNRKKVPFLVSYDGRTGDKVHGQTLPASLSLVHLEICAGRSSQATLLGRKDNTYESLYLSKILADQIGFDNADFYGSPTRVSG